MEYLSLGRVGSIVVRLALYMFYLVVPLIVAVASYRLLFHPLRKYPGPLLARLTYAYGGYYTIKKNCHYQIYEEMKQYGPVYRVGPNRLLFNSLTAIEAIFLNQEVEKGVSYYNSRWDMRPAILDTIGNKAHSRKRRIIGQPLSDISMRTFQPIVSQHITIFLRQLLEASKAGEYVNVSTLFKYMTTDIIGRLSFGHRFDCLTKETNRGLMHSIEENMTIFHAAYSWPTFSYLLPLLRKLATKKILLFKMAVEAIIRDRMAKPIDAHFDLYSITVDKFDPPNYKHIMRSELWNEALFFIGAGGLTTAATLSGIMFNLCNHPKAYKRLAGEVRGTFTSGRDIYNGPQLAGCKYLRAVIDESLRCSGSTISTFWRQHEKSSNKPFVVDGHIIPPGTEVGMNAYSLLHSEEYFPKPFDFIPERWLAPEDGGFENEESRAKMKRAHVSFGLGNRICAGKRLANIEMTIVLARIFWYFDFQIAPGEAGKLGAGDDGATYRWGKADQFQMRDVFASSHDGPNVVFKARPEVLQELESWEDEAP